MSKNMNGTAQAAAKKRLSWRSRILLMIGGVIGAVVLLEVVARAAGWLPTPPPESFFHLRQFVGPLPDPYETIVYSAPGDEFSIPVRFNYRSLRDVDHDYTPPANSTRVMFLGDSFTAGWQVQADQNYVARLRVSLNALADRPTHYDLINAGFHGWGTDRQYLFYREEGYKYQSDLVVLQIYAGNDVFDNGVKVLGWGEHDQLLPGFTLDEAGELVYVPFTGKLPDPYSAPADGSPFSTLRWFLDRNSFSYRLLRGLLQRQDAGDAISETPTLTPTLTPTPTPAVPLDMNVYSHSASQTPQWEQAWAITFALIRQLRSEVEAHGGRFAVMLVRSRWETDPASWDAAKARYGLTADYDPALPARRFLEFLDGESLPYLDLGVPLSRYQAESGQVIAYPLDAHWTAAGHCAAAAAVQNWLLAEQLIPTPQTVALLDPLEICHVDV